MNRIKKIYIKKFKQFEDFEIKFNESEDNIYSVISKNGLGKSNLLQFIFVMVNVLKSEEFHLLLKNLLENEIKNFSNEKTLFSEFEFVDNNIKYYIVPIEWNEINFKFYEEFEALKSYQKELKNKIFSLERLEKLLSNISDIPELILRRELRDIFLNLDNRRIYEESMKFLKENKLQLKDFLSNYIKNKKGELIDYDTIKRHIEEIKEKIDKYNSILEQKNLYKLCKINEYYLLYEINNIENIPDVYLAAPNYQPFHFLRKEEKENLLENFEEYISELEILRDTLNNKIYFYNIVNKEEIKNIEDYLAKLDKEYLDKTEKYGNNLPSFKQELKKILDDKIILTTNGVKIIYQDKKINLTDLSHGELKKLSLYLWSKYYPTKNSIILFDEIELSFHPSWQIEIIENLKDWLKNKQIIIATHSPQVLNNINYKNIILLHKKENKIETINFNKPPINRDVNSILKEIMGSEFIPKRVLKLRNEFEKAYFNKENEKAEKIKEELLKWEGDEYIRRIEYLYLLGKEK